MQPSLENGDGWLKGHLVVRLEVREAGACTCDLAHCELRLILLRMVQVLSGRLALRAVALYHRCRKDVTDNMNMNRP